MKYMNEEHQAQLTAFEKKVDSCMNELTNHIGASDRDVQTLQRVVFGDSETGEKGMKEKVDEMHEILIGFKGIKGLFGILIMVGILIATLKGWFSN